MLFDSLIRYPLVGAAVGKQICSFDCPLFEAEPPRFLGFKLSIFHHFVNLEHTSPLVLFL